MANITLAVKVVSARDFQTPAIGERIHQEAEKTWGFPTEKVPWDAYLWDRVTIERTVEALGPSALSHVVKYSALAVDRTTFFDHGEGDEDITFASWQSCVASAGRTSAILVPKYEHRREFSVSLRNALELLTDQEERPAAMLVPTWLALDSEYRAEAPLGVTIAAQEFGRWRSGPGLEFEQRVKEQLDLETLRRRSGFTGLPTDPRASRRLLPNLCCLCDGLLLVRGVVMCLVEG